VGTSTGIFSMTAKQEVNATLMIRVDTLDVDLKGEVVLDHDGEVVGSILTGPHKTESMKDAAWVLFENGEASLVETALNGDA